MQTFSCGEALGGHLGVGCGQCFPIKEFVPIPRLQVSIMACSGLKVKEIASGMYHTVCLIEGGSVFAWGRNNDGQCGVLPSEQPICYVPTEVMILRWTVVTKVACGCCHSLAITEHGRLFSWGWDNYGKIIQNQDVNIHAESPRLTEDVITIFAGLPAQTQRTLSDPTEVFIKSGECEAVVVDVSGGFGFTSCITLGGKVYSWGFNDHGQLGNGTNMSYMIVPTKVEFFLSYKCLSVACGFDYTFVIARQLHTGWEKVNAFGGNSSGQLGLVYTSGVSRSESRAPVSNEKQARICPSTGTVAAVWATPTWLELPEQIYRLHEISCGPDARHTFVHFSRRLSAESEVAVLMSMHPRLGENSLLRLLESDLLRLKSELRPLNFGI
ncbi:hypothetical protein GUITHDRAFT_105788 [Guillardia theta CCMP2712]|uniref:Uncharacterized protein n=1 Tax=Guillardia theta (strain CCMP2712) TaxID=905079 RepID=L1JJE1_GUITC|nr:hypothetical protein GUITHDRAFT_105788 [Guillardia theta CCMP2712]EKX48643.1 hypothetical protein GUITHDRAFT_105788 [Guillardia theta CCMP2712]|eukprot:XP_005835623.1 hypothetical protein GUITHDRAFT_105788 [Guillardia theta CCMP2712]